MNLSTNFPASSDAAETLPVAKSPAEAQTSQAVGVEAAGGDSLFSIPESLSPRMLWMKEHDVRTQMVEYDHAGPTDPEDLWMAVAAGKKARGRDEDEAIVKLAIKLGIKLWNESGVKS